MTGVEEGGRERGSNINYLAKPLVINTCLTANQIPVCNFPTRANTRSFMVGICCANILKILKNVELKQIASQVNGAHIQFMIRPVAATK